MLIVAAVLGPDGGSEGVTLRKAVLGDGLRARRRGPPGGGVRFLAEPGSVRLRRWRLPARVRPRREQRIRRRSGAELRARGRVRPGARLQARQVRVRRDLVQVRVLRSDDARVPARNHGERLRQLGHVQRLPFPGDLHGRSVQRVRDHLHGVLRGQQLPYLVAHDLRYGGQGMRGLQRHQERDLLRGGGMRVRRWPGVQRWPALYRGWSVRV